MAVDFLQSNRYRSLFLADGILKRIRLKMAKLGDDRFGKLDKEREQQQAQKESCNRTQAEFQEYAHQHHDTDCNHSSSQESRTVSETQEENSPSGMNLNGDVAMNDHNITRPKLKINPPNVLVWIPKPPNNPRGTHSSFFNPSTAGRDQTGESSSRNLTQNAIVAASTQEDTLVDAQMSESFFQIDSQDNPLQNHVALDQGKIKDSRDSFQAEESTPESDNTHQQITEEKMFLPMITQSRILSSLNEVSADSCGSTGYSDVQEDHVQRVKSEDKDQNLPDDREDDGYAMCNLEADTDDDDDVAISTNINNEHKHENVKDLPKTQAETDGVNDKRGNSSNCGVNDSSNNQAIDSLSNERSEHLTKGRSSECQDDNIIDTEDNMTYEDEVYPPKKPKVMVTNHKREIADINSNKSLSKKNHFLNLMHFLFDMRLKRTDVDEDTEPLVDEEITEDVTRQIETKVETKKRWSCRLSIFGQRRDIGETRRVSPSPTAKKKKKKRRRPRKKNVHRAGRRLRKNLDRGCRNISYGFSYLVTEIPESPPATSSCGTNGCSKSLGYEDDAPNDRLHSDTAAPPNPRKKQFITLEAF